jgi:3-hydroxybutyryl-CoA dehydratase
MPLIGNTTYDELAIGDSATYTRTLTEEEILIFATVTGDLNPFHLDSDYAGSTVFRERIGHGMWSGALISAAVTNIMPGPGTIYLEQSLRFLQPIRIQDSLVVTIQVEEKLSEGRVVLGCMIKNQQNEIVVDGKAKVIAPKTKIHMEKPELPEISIKQ